jgi:hypothetical protein
MLWSGLGYVLFIFASISLFDFYTPVDQRIMMPVFASTLAAIGLLKPPGSDGWRRISYVFAVTLLVSVLLAGIPGLAAAGRLGVHHGVGYFGSTFRDSPLVARLANVTDVEIYSNARELIEVYTGRKTYPLPTYYDPSSARYVDGYGAEMDALVAGVQRGEAIVVLFRAFLWRRYFPDESVFGDNLSLPVVYDGADGVVFGRARFAVPPQVGDQ